MRAQLILVVVALAALPLSAQSKKEAWNYSLEERIALLTDPELARERVLRDRGHRATVGTTNSQLAPVVDSFNGRTNPELFLPTQVFGPFVMMVFEDPKTSFVLQKGFSPDLRRLGLPSDFWKRLQAITADFVADDRAVRELLASLRNAEGPAADRLKRELALRYDEHCRSRADALAEARREFGRERLDRFLYEVLATKMFSVSDKLPDPAVLRRTEEGCR